MKKESFQFPEVEKTVRIEGKSGTPSAVVSTYISWELEQLLTATYVEMYFNSGDDEKTNFVVAERIFDFMLLKEMTSINVDLKKYTNEDGKNISLDLAYESGFMASVKKSIVNLAIVYGRTQRAVEDIKQEKYSPIGFVKDLTKVLESADIAGLMEKVSGLKEFVSNSPLSSLMDEGKQG
jgi:hypothetical protein